MVRGLFGKETRGEVLSSKSEVRFAAADLFSVPLTTYSSYHLPLTTCHLPQRM